MQDSDEIRALIAVKIDKKEGQAKSENKFKKEIKKNQRKQFDEVCQSVKKEFISENPAICKPKGKKNKLMERMRYNIVTKNICRKKKPQKILDIEKYRRKKTMRNCKKKTLA